MTKTRPLAKYVVRLGERAQVSFARAFDFVEAAENARANVVAALEAAIADGNATIAKLQTAVENINATIAGLGPAIISGSIPTASEISALVAELFAVDLSFDIETTSPGDFTVMTETKTLSIGVGRLRSPLRRR